MRMIKRLNKSDGEDGHMNAWALDFVTIQEDGDDVEEYDGDGDLDDDWTASRVIELNSSRSPGEGGEELARGRKTTAGGLRLTFARVQARTTATDKVTMIDDVTIWHSSVL